MVDGDVDLVPWAKIVNAVKQKKGLPCRLGATTLNGCILTPIPLSAATKGAQRRNRLGEGRQPTSIPDELPIALRRAAGEGKGGHDKALGTRWPKPKEALAEGRTPTGTETNPKAPHAVPSDNDNPFLWAPDFPRRTDLAALIAYSGLVLAEVS